MKKMYLLLLACVCIAANGYCQSESDNPDTIIFKDKDDAVYKLISKGDRVPQLFVNGVEQSRKQLDKHAQVIDRLQRELDKKRAKQLQRNNAEKSDQMKKLISQLVADKILASATALTSLLLDPGNFIVNGKEQSWPLLEKYKTLFNVTSSNSYHFNYK